MRRAPRIPRQSVHSCRYSRTRIKIHISKPPLPGFRPANDSHQRLTVIAHLYASQVKFDPKFFCYVLKKFSEIHMTL